MSAGEARLKDEYTARRRAYREQMRHENLDGVLVTHLPDIRYLCGFTGSSGMVLLLPRRGLFLTDFRYREQSAREIVGLKTIVYETGPEKSLLKTLGDDGLLRIGFDPEFLSYKGTMSLRRYLKGKASFVPLKRSLTLLRARKSRLELEKIRKGIRIAEEAFRDALREVERNTTETDLALAVDTVARRKGAEGPAFETIVASGLRGALVHASPSRRRLRGAAVIDWGVMYEGYCTDATRTVAFGRVPDAVRKAHLLVLEAQERAMEKIRPGVRARDVDRAAREVIEEAGLGDAFGHGLGHGVGLEVHERPYVGKTSRDVLEEGMVITNEPGIYLSGVGGVRVEDMLLVTSQGAELLTTLPRTLDPGGY
ncbi:MAG: aminopeptidase P family protein [Actinobacteria bacterium]|nr:aminopeptidase P family protein [Actinomycetota bacterium]